MKQLELRYYTRQEIAEVLSVNLQDSSHFKRNVETTLSKWGYSYQYSTLGVTITRIPESAEERLKEILIRVLKLDVQIDPYDYSCFLTAFSDIDGFTNMPWDKRAEVLENVYNVKVCSRTLRNWCAILIHLNLIQKNGEKVFWKTEYCNGMKQQTIVTDSEQTQMRDYFRQMSDLVTEEYQNALNYGLSPKEAKQEAWKRTYRQLWHEFNCCYYSCKGFHFNALSDLDRKTMLDIFELTRELVGIDPKSTEKEKLYE